MAAAALLALGWLILGLAGLLRLHSVEFVGRVLFPFGAALSLLLALTGLAALSAPPASMTLAIGLPDLPFHLHLDALSAFFLLLLGAASAGISVFAAGYFRSGEGTAPGLLCLQYHVFLASMVFVLLAADAYAFMVAWETMALSSYFLVTTQHRIPEIRRAGFLYLLIAHVGAIGILLAFGVLQGGSWQFTFDAMRAAELSPLWSSIAFGLALFGFGAKAGLVPLHVWLPEAHPAAPSPVSALMSGVMLKTALYGILRVSFDLLGAPLWWWGALALALGLFSALFGVVFAAVQTDMKRLLAYSSIENIGIAFAAFGLSILFHCFAMPQLAALALAAMLYHCLNHAFFKSLLFLATGSVLHATRERRLGKLGGLIRTMPWVAWLALVGTLAIAGLPPLNGFVSEWLLLQAFLFTPEIPQPFANMLIPLGAPALALTAALAGYVMVKFYGVIFLGRMREPQLAQAHDCGILERIGLAWLAAACVALGLTPALMLQALDPVGTLLLGSGLGTQSTGSWLLVPVSAERASYSPLLFLVGIGGSVLLTVWAVRRLYHGRIRRAAPWDCGFPLQTARMQDSAEGFGQPIRHIFDPFFRMRRELPSPLDSAPRYRVEVEDRFWHALYLPVAGGVKALAGFVGRLQRGRISVYLLYSFLTLVALLVIVL
ncbi:hydrogenase 4 subunit B [Fontimonas sp. SYSU GA230001]|uniref:hydrogenase 4 subunit B n=1 Tax=Fontimonas sp. SYSU GA230001 TaxID=3142450 RepID=UPI0032B4A2D8